ncbi:bifunctional phosphoribosylaminoimidazolecarboxamide formyltransferase/IMP cyclohydrolase [Actinomycetota bacterium]
MSGTVTAPGPTANVRPVKRALVSVYDKSGLEDLARGLHEAGVAIISTGSTASRIADAGVPVTPVEEITGFPECLEGRVKTLHPKVHAGILADTRKEDHLAQLDELGVAAFDLVVVNLYPFTETVASGATPDECVEQIDIGGPTMVRAAAKNHPSVAIVTDPGAYGEVVEAAKAGGFTLAQRQRLAMEAFRHTAAYDVAVATWLGNAVVGADEPLTFPDWLGQTFTKSATLRYGENPHQQAALYVAADGSQGLAQARQLHGKEMSYNNYIDGDAAYRAAYDQGDRPTCAIIKHANPCGIAIGGDIAEAHRKAHDCDPLSAFGGIIAVNREVTAEMAETVKDIFTEVVIAPSYAPAALEILTAKKNIRLLECPAPVRGGLETRPVTGGLLVQERDQIDAVISASDDDKPTAGHGDDPINWTRVAGDDDSSETLGELNFAWRAVRAVKSNAILLSQQCATVGIGMGQVNRVDSCRLAVQRAGEERARGSVAASDAFFPFADGPQVLIDAGVRAIVAPGGSMRDQETIDACEAAGVTLYFTGTRHFAH